MVTHNTDSFKREDGSAEEPRPTTPVRHPRYGVYRGHVLEHVIERDDHADTDQQVCDHWKRSQVLEITY